ncbi:MAG TPA: hypothetical protein VKB41_08295 [Steroidobacteraceae bacterium]|nr:hypothetical protein [Steroidobacteraceae bacterium]
MKMNYLGRGMYHEIKNPGDFSYRIDGEEWQTKRVCRVARVGAYSAPGWAPAEAVQVLRALEVPAGEMQP